MLYTLMLFSVITFELLFVATAQLRVHEWEKIKKYELIRKRTTKNCQCEEHYADSAWGEWSRCESVGKLTCHRALRYRMMACSSRSSCMKEEWWHCLDSSTCPGKWERVNPTNPVTQPTCDPECVDGLKPILHLCTNNGTIGEFCDRRGYYKIMMSPCKNSQGCNVTAEMASSVHQDIPFISEGTPLAREDTVGNFEVNMLVWILGGVVILLFILAASLTFCFASNRQKQKLAENQLQNNGNTEQVNMGSWSGDLRRKDKIPKELPPALPNIVNNNHSQFQPITTGRNGLARNSPRKPRMNRLLSEPVVSFTRNPQYASMGSRGQLGSPPQSPSDQYFVPFDSKTTLPGTKPNYAVPNSRPAPPRTIERLSSAARKPWYDVPKVLGEHADNSMVKTLPKMSVNFGRVQKHGTIVEAPIQLEDEDTMYEKIN